MPLLALLAALPFPAASAAVERLGGRVALDATLRAQWCWSGTFRFPVGDPHELGGEGPSGEPGFGVNRNVGDRGGHQGADLDNRRGGDPVCAAAHGLVIAADGEGWGGGYGAHVVIAHRLLDESIVFSVYAHLAPGTIRVRSGDRVASGTVVGRVGRTGRATTEHLHFEIRRPDDPEQPWERGRVVDPIAFVLARLPLQDDTTAFRPYLAWAEDAGLMLPGAALGDAIDHARWWTILAHAACHGAEKLPDDPAGLEPMLVDAGVLPTGEARAGDTVGWTELKRDLDRLRKTRVRVFPIEVDEDVHRRARDLALAESRGSNSSRRAPTLAQALVLLADVAGVADPGSARGRRRGGS